MKIRKKEKHVLGWIALWTYFSGAALFIFSRYLRITSPVGEQHHPLEYWTRVFHTGLTYFVILGIGYMIKGHVLPSLKAKAKPKLFSGSGNLIILFVLTASALGTLYTSESLWGAIHTYLGFLSPVVILFHAVKKWS